MRMTNWKLDLLTTLLKNHVNSELNQSLCHYSGYFLLSCPCELPKTQIRPDWLPHCLKICSQPTWHGVANPHSLLFTASTYAPYAPATPSSPILVYNTL